MEWFRSLCFVVVMSCVVAIENCAESNSERCRNMKKEKAAHPKSKVPVTSRSSGYPWEKTSGYWTNLGHHHVLDKIKQRFNTNRAKNVIFFLGDGMSIATLFATRVALGGEEQQLFFEKFPYSGLSKTYCVDAQVSDSACTGTAYMTGVKANYNTIGVNAKVSLGDCKAGNDPSTHTHSIAKWALDAGKSAGIVTTARVTHASPAASYAHVADRDWEDDFMVYQSGCNPRKTVDIARQLVHGPVGSRFSVILGGGRGNLRDSTMPDEEGGFGYRNDSRDLISEWLKDGRSREYVWNREGLLNLPSDIESVLGLFEKSHMQYYLESQERGSQSTVPTLEEMTRTAIDVLKKNKEGFFLFVEGAKIDLSHHELMARAAVWETIEFNKAIRTARNMMSEDDTLIVVTADHSHTMTVSGYPTRGNDIFGKVDREPEIGTDGLPYMTLNYANGRMDPNQYSVNGRVNPDTLDFSKWSSMFPYYVPIEVEESHGGDDVGVFASGPYAHLFSGTMEQSFLPHLMAYAASIGEGPKCP